MALTKISGSVIKDSVSLSGNVSVGGTLTYQDVTNVDALGIGTFRTGINVSGGQLDVGSNIKIGNAGIITATELDISGDIDVDGHTELDNVNIAGIVTVSSDGINAGILDLKTGGNLRLRFSSGGTAQFRGDVDPIANFDRGSANSTNVKWGYLGADRGIISSISNEFRIAAAGTTPMTFHTNGAEKARIDSSGRLLLGTTTEGYSTGDRLTIAGNGHTGMTIRSGASQGGNIFFSDGTSGADEYRGVVSYDHTNNFMRFYTNAAERLRIDSSGRVLIGTTDLGGGNADDLTVATSGNTGITIRSGTSNTGNIFFSDATSGAAQYAGAIEFHHSTDSLNLNVGNTAIVRIVKDSTTPAVGVGILPQAGQYNGWTVLQIGESAALTSNRTTADTNQTELSNNSYLNSNASAYKYHHADEATRYVQSHGRHTFYSAASGSADANITFSEVMKIDASGRVTKPLTPAFNVKGGNMTRSDTSGYICQFSNKTASGTFDNGNNFNTSTYKFVAPVSGHYYFFTNIRLDSFNSGYIRTAILSTSYNTNTTYYAIPSTGHVITYADNGSIQTVQTSTVMYLGVNQEAWVYQNPNSDTSFTCYLNESSFGGYLIG